MQQQIDEQIRATDQLLKVSTQNQRVIQPQASNNFQYVPASAQPNQYASAMPDNFAANSTANRTLPQFSNTAAVPSRFPSPQPFAPFQNQTNTGGTLNHSGLQPFPPAQGRNYDAQKNQSTAGFNPFLAAQGESSPAPMVATNATRGAAFNPFSNNGHYQPITPPLQVQSQFTGGYTQPLSGNGNQPPMMQTFATGGSNYSVQTTNPYAPPSPRLAYSNIQAGMTQYPQQQQAFGNQQQPVAQNPFYQNIPKGNQQFNTQQTSIAGSFSDLASSTSKVQHNPFGN